MIAGSSAESLLLVIETTRRGEGVIAGVRKELADMGVDAKSAGSGIAAGMSAGIAEVERLSKTIDVTSKKDVAALKATTASVREMATAAGVAPAEIGKLATAEAALEARLRSATAATVAADRALETHGATATRTAARVDAMSPKVRTAANAMSVLSFSAAGFSTTGPGAMVAAGNLAQSLAALSTSATIAAGATGIGALAVVLGTIITLMGRAKTEAADMSATLDVIRTVGSAAEAAAVSRQIDQQLAVAQGKLDAVKKQQQAIAQVGGGGIQANIAAGIFGRTSGKAALEAEVEGLTKAAATAYKSYADQLGAAGQRAGEEWTAKAKAEAERLKQIRIADAKTAAGLLVTVPQEAQLAWLRYHDRVREAETKQLQFQRERRIAEVEALKIDGETKKRLILAIEDSIHAAVASNDKAWAARRAAYQNETASMAAGMSGNVAAQYEARVKEIEQQAEVELKANNTKEAVEGRTQLRIRQLRRETLRAAMGDLKTLEEATINSKHREIRAIGMAAAVFRRLLIGAEAADALVKSAKAFALVPGYLAAHKYGSAALSAASGVQLAAAAALGFKEAMSGGGGGGSAGGSGGNNNDRDTFEPRSPTAPGGQGYFNLTIITRNPYGRDEIQNTLFELNRAGILNRQAVQLPPTTGVKVFAA